MIQRDKLQHAGAGAALATLALIIGGSPVAAALVVLLAALGKEAWDATGRGTCDPWDALWTLAGGAVPIALHIALT